MCDNVPEILNEVEEDDEEEIIKNIEHQILMCETLEEPNDVGDTEEMDISQPGPSKRNKLN